jgi:F-type H+-transporting ATPase subunit a
MIFKRILLATLVVGALTASADAQTKRATKSARTTTQSPRRATKSAQRTTKNVEKTTKNAEPATAPAEHTEQAAEPTAAAHKHIPGPADIIMPHLTDSKHIELPCVKGWEEWACELSLPTWNVSIAGKTIDFGPTKHVVFLFLSALIVALTLVITARAHVRHTHAVGRPKGFAAGIEGVILYLRNEIYIPVLGGHGGEKYVPFVMSLFFFIAMCNLFGLLPYGSTATGNVNVTAGLAILTFIVVEIAGMKALGAGYFNTVVYWPHDMPLGMKLPLTLVMTPVEIIGKFTKPFALTIRLFANMIAGHVIILVLIGLIFMFGWSVAIGSVPMALFIMLLELLVAFIQAFIFSLLAAVFIGQIRASHH